MASVVARMWVSTLLVVTLLHLMKDQSASVTASPNQHTHVTNESGTPIRATLKYIKGNGHSKFTNRLILPQNSQSDVYVHSISKLRLEVWVDGAQGQSMAAEITGDRSVVAYDNPGLGFGGVDIFLTKYGSLYDKDDIYPLVTIFPNL